MKTRHRFTVMVAAAVTMCLAGGAWAQRGPGGPRLSPEKAAAAWALQAGGVAGELGLSDSDSARLATTYKTARESQGAAIRELGGGRPGGGGPGGGRPGGPGGGMARF